MDISTTSPATFDDAPGIGMALLADGTSARHTRVDVATLAPGSSLPRHAAGTDQVFHVVSGTGRVAAGDGVEHAVSAGTTVRWSRGEQHTSWADTEMTVVIVQVRPAQPAETSDAAADLG
ncbi:cupin domain-containing protein [Sanguibacter keddieii DSM 10542]|uniref:Cupin domain-containing protein n=1 Tax=Sanguibacter keddieii (strain ATCC 51767 / DSM 10542 / NCFB 3025 / ST-74) TaxID=446469 RepID=D1BAE4_SANKS|nr:cupin domain-containing protein [Sanguibacter keddieii]ACZ20495.1 cupin domain-containing protein [Sanguibacter keddieii DSM 10542]